MPQAIVVLVFALCAAGAALARAADEPVPRLECLSSGDALEAVSTREVVSPARAMGLARAAEPEGEIVRASLCREAGALVYVVLALKKDGRLIRVTVDAKAGKIKLVH